MSKKILHKHIRCNLHHTSVLQSEWLSKKQTKFQGSSFSKFGLIYNPKLLHTKHTLFNDACCKKQLNLLHISFNNLHVALALSCLKCFTKCRSIPIHEWCNFWSSSDMITESSGGHIIKKAGLFSFLWYWRLVAM